MQMTRKFVIGRKTTDDCQKASGNNKATETVKTT